jgi:hypothetical protein
MKIFINKGFSELMISPQRKFASKGSAVAPTNSSKGFFDDGNCLMGQAGGG